MRKVTIYSGNGSTKEINFNGDSFQALQGAMCGLNIIYDKNKMNAIVSDGVHDKEITEEDQELPQGDFSIFILPQKVKSGAIMPPLSSENENEIEENEEEMVDIPNHFFNFDPLADSPAHLFTREETLGVISHCINISTEVINKKKLDDVSLLMLRQLHNELRQIYDYTKNVRLDQKDEQARILARKYSV